MALRGLGPLPNTAQELGFGQDGYSPASRSLKAVGRQAGGRGAWLGHRAPATPESPWGQTKVQWYRLRDERSLSSILGLLGNDLAHQQHHVSKTSCSCQCVLFLSHWGNQDNHGLGSSASYTINSPSAPPPPGREECGIPISERWRQRL